MKNQSGQTLVEMVVAIAVLIVVVLALLSVTTTSIRNASFSRDQALATKYAQDAIEKVRAYRDQNPWRTFTVDCENILAGVALPPPFSFTPVPDCYVPGGAANCSESDQNCEVKVVVSWSDVKGSHKSELKTRLTNWK